MFLIEVECNHIENWCNTLIHKYKTDEPGNIAVCHSILIQLIVFLSQRFEKKSQNILQSDFEIAKSFTNKY